MFVCLFYTWMMGKGGSLWNVLFWLGGVVVGTSVDPVDGCGMEMEVFSHACSVHERYRCIIHDHVLYNLDFAVTPYCLRSLSPSCFCHSIFDITALPRLFSFRPICCR